VSQADDFPADNIPKERTEAEARLGWLIRRREKIIAEIERNRQGDYKVPTWVLAAILVAFLVAWAVVIIFA
jgi:hypothetical protein